MLRRLIISVAILVAVAGAAHAAPRAHLHPQIRTGLRAQTGGPCGTGIAHCTTLTWMASVTSGVTYNVFRGTVSGGESTTPQNASPITGLTFVDPVTLTNSPQTIFYCIEAVETTSGVTASSLCSAAEISVTFPGTPSAPAGVAGTPH